MKTVSSILLLLTLLLFGCQHPTEVQVKQDTQPDPVQVTPVPVDTLTAYQNPIDSTAITPEDQQKYFAFMLVTATQFDAGGIVASSTVSNVRFLDTSRAFRFGGRTLGYWGMNIGPLLASPLTINGHSMLQIPHRIREGIGSAFFGWEYYWLEGGKGGIDSVYTWSAQTDSIGTINVSINAPGPLTVSAPKGGGVYQRDENLSLRWDGPPGEQVLIYLSSVNQLTGDTRPLMMFKPLGTSGKAVINSNVLKALPLDRHYVLSFVLANRRIIPGLTNFHADVLAQAAFVYNTYIEIR